MGKRSEGWRGPDWGKREDRILDKIDKERGSIDSDEITPRKPAPELKASLRERMSAKGKKEETYKNTDSLRAK